MQRVWFAGGAQRSGFFVCVGDRDGVIRKIDLVYDI
jgi:hypothetical protein